MAYKTYKMKNALPSNPKGSRDATITLKRIELMCHIGNLGSLKMGAQKSHMLISSAYSEVRDMKELYHITSADENKKCCCRDVLNFLMDHKVIALSNNIYINAISYYFDEVQPELPLEW
jgi:hypothetical protein